MTISRRRLVTGAAWTTPSVLLTASAPTLAASICEPTPEWTAWLSRQELALADQGIQLSLSYLPDAGTWQLESTTGEASTEGETYLAGYEAVITYTDGTTVVVPPTGIQVLPPRTRSTQTAPVSAGHDLSQVTAIRLEALVAEYDDPSTPDDGSHLTTRTTLSAGTLDATTCTVVGGL